MNSLLKLKIESVTKQYYNALEQGLSKFAPRNGFYYVKAFEFRDIRNGSYPFITANWKANREDLFVAEATFELAVSSLHAADSKSQLDYSNIIGKTLQVFRVGIQLSNDNGIEKAVVHGLWLYEYSEPKFLDGNSLLFGAIGSEIKSLEDGTLVIASEFDNGIDNEIPLGLVDDYTFEEGDPSNNEDLSGSDEERRDDNRSQDDNNSVN
ncbi:hypothetical protein [Mucilaginibacter sp. HD30]